MDMYIKRAICPCFVEDTRRVILYSRMLENPLVSVSTELPSWYLPRNMWSECAKKVHLLSSKFQAMLYVYHYCEFCNFTPQLFSDVFLGFSVFVIGKSCGGVKSQNS